MIPICGLCMALCVCVCAHVSQEVMEYGQRISVPCCLFPSPLTFPVSKFTKPKLSQSTKNTRNNHSLFNVVKGLCLSSGSISMWWHQGIFWGIRFSLLPHSYSFILYFFFSSGWWRWFCHSSGSRLFSRRSLLRQKSISRVCLSNLWPLHKHSRMAGGVRERMQHTPRSSEPPELAHWWPFSFSSQHISNRWDQLTGVT